MKLSKIIGALLVLLARPIAADPLPDPITGDAYRKTDPVAVRLGQLLFYDPILSGNRNISCASCHHPRFGTGDGVSLNIGEGGLGLGPDRVADPLNPPEELVPRNAPALWNLGAHEFTVLFHDGRIETDPSRPTGLRTPLEDEMVEGFANVLSAQTMFPVLSQDEMAGHYAENDVAKATRQGLITGPGGSWDRIARRVTALPEYRAGFEEWLGKPGAEVTFADISNAISDFIAAEWRADQSPFDAHLRGDMPLEGSALQGMTLFYGEAGCSSCHSGPFQSDHSFHAMGVPQFGPGKAARFEQHTKDLGRMRVTGRAEDAYAFRTPSLRNITVTAPYGHTGSHLNLRAFLLHHIDPRRPYDPAQAVLPVALHDPFRPLLDLDEAEAILAAVPTSEIILDEAEIDAILAFLNALTDEGAVAGRLGVPHTVPSGLPVDR
ncbi:cytochrome c peroxidase [Poseidonocella pacifica]|uniref:Cytochrome c peroxidase n=1 Tax=Poseidonocella pacifica TaxID=871651 RepID=A0A1I0WLK5_9RHOB|nr:cytochrome c peroxidase [Poseidonocella pacifica]SFA89078.1 cytochrome c peroxidase [Poseidonocella pacifica]